MSSEHIFESFDRNEVDEFQKAINPDYWERKVRTDPETLEKVYVLSWFVLEPIEPHEGKDPNESHWNCGACGYPLWEDEYYCAHCGCRIKWK